jgi:hypothetical protein
MSDPLPERRLASRAAFLAGGLSAGLALVYLVWIDRQGDEFTNRTWLVAGWFVVAAVLFLAGAFTHPPRRRALLAGAAACMLVPLAIIGMWSIGPIVLVLALIGGGAASVAAHEGGIGPWRRVGAAILLVGAAAGLMVIGIMATA